MMNKKPIFAIDLGLKQTKMRSEKTKKSFPSFFTYFEDLGTERMKFNDGKKISKYISNVEQDTEYAWGEDLRLVSDDVTVIDTLDFSNRYRTDEFRLLANFAMAELAKDFEEAKHNILDVVVVTGVPSNDYNEENIKDIMKAFKRDHTVQIDGQRYVVRCDEVHVMEQLIGTVYNEMLNDSGEIINESFFDDTVTVVDIGGGTVLVDTLRGLKIQPERSAQRDRGAYFLYDKILTKVYEKNIKGLTQPELELILRNPSKDGDYLFKPNKNESVNITDIVNTQVKRYTRDIKSFVKTTVKRTNDIDTFIFTGGGSNLINKKEIQNTFEYVTFAQDSEYANVNGYYKYGIAIQQEENGDE